MYVTRASSFMVYEYKQQPGDVHQLHAASELASVVGFLLQLGFREAGRPLPVAAMPPLERDVAGHLAQLGLLLPFRRVPHQERARGQGMAPMGHRRRAQPGVAGHTAAPQAGHLRIYGGV